MKELSDKIPSPRILVTGHDAFNYFGKTFNLEIHATDFVTTEAERTAKQISELATLIADKKVPVIFMDNQVDPQAIKSLQEAVKAKGWNVRVSNKELFADSLGAEKGLDTYLGVYEHNVKTVVEELTKK
ncbi:MAG: zinc ABC transporter substrate-binding protein, partial [Microbacteriaceae bacterium]|nr:zinc ABC transporter substrate-binding protein [Microbacteriaceae bacterium]